MPKINKLMPVPDYIGGGENPEKLLVQKSNPLLSLSETAMTLPELKILDVYLSRINSHEPDKRHVQLEKGELEKLLGVTRIPTKDLEKRIDNLFQVITVRDETKAKGFTKIALFERVDCGQCKDGLWKIDLMCTPSAMEYIFNIENIGYLKYRLKSVVNLTSRYSYILYLFLADYCYQGTSEIQLDDLKKMLNCTAATYSEFKEFNKQVLKKCHKEINEKTDISYTYTTIKKGRTVVAISFDVERKADAEPFIDPAKLPMPEPEELPVEEDELNGYENNHISECAFVCGNEFNNEQMKAICQEISEIDLPHSGLGRDFDEYDFLADMYYRLRKYTDGRELDNKRRFSYIMKMIKNYKKDHLLFPQCL